MAKKKMPDVNAAEEIRKYRREHPNAMPVDVQASLRQRGIRVSTAYISTISHVEKKRAQKHVPTVSTDSLLAMKEFIEEIGSIEEAREVVARLERIGGLSAASEAIELIDRIAIR